MKGGAIPTSIREQIAANDGQSKESAWDGKQSVGQDLALCAAGCLSQLRPSIVIAEGTTDSAMREEVVVEKALNKVTLGRRRTVQKVVLKDGKKLLSDFEQVIKECEELMTWF